MTTQIHPRRRPLRTLTIAALAFPSTYAFQPSPQTTRLTTRLSSTTEKPPTKKTPLVPAQDLFSATDLESLLDLSSYESSLLDQWADKSLQKGFDWEIEKLRRRAAGMRQRPDGSWARAPSLFDFLVSSSGAEEIPYGTPKPVNIYDVGVLIVKNLLSSIGFGPSLGMAAVPNAIIQKYEGSFFSFIRGVLGGDLQTLAGGPLFLLLAKYYQDYGPIFNLSFGPKSFLVISDPVMARHILNGGVDDYCKGMLGEILEPIMGDGLIPADPKIWKVRDVYRWELLVSG